MDDFRDAAEPIDETELAVEGALRPTSLAEFVGQQKVRGQLQLLLDAARMQQRPPTTSCCPVLLGSARPRWR